VKGCCGSAQALTSQISGVWSSAYSFGQVVGPVVGGVLDSTIGINWGSFAFAMACAVGAALHGYGTWRARASVHVAAE